MPEQPTGVRVGRVMAVAHADSQSRDDLANRLYEKGFEGRETPHFLVCRPRSTGGRTIVMHTFSTATIDEDLSPMVADELGPLDVVTTLQEYGDALFAIVASTSPASLRCPDC